MKSPAECRVVAFCHRFGNVVEHRRPAQPLVVGLFRHIVEHLERMVEIVLVSSAVNHLRTFQCLHFGENQLQQSALLQQDEAARRLFRPDHLAKFIENPFPRNDGDALAVAGNGRECFRINFKIKLCSKTNGPHHTQRVVGKRNVGVERRTDNAPLQIVESAERIDKLTEIRLVHAHCHGIDGEVAAFLVILQRAVLHNRLTAVMAVRLLACSDKFKFQTFVFHLCRTEIAIHRQRRFRPQL